MHGAQLHEYEPDTHGQASTRAMTNPNLQTRLIQAGYCPSYLPLPIGPWPRLIDFLIHRFPRVPVWVWSERLEQGWLWEARQGRPIAANALYTPLQRCHGGLYYERIRPALENPLSSPLRVCGENEYILAIDKPHGIPVTPGGLHGRRSVLMQLRQQGYGLDITPVHRLDKDTAGVVLFVKHRGHRRLYHDLFEQRQVKKRYLAVAPYRPEDVFPLTRQTRLKPDPAHFFRSIEVPGLPNSQTHIERLEMRGEWALYELRPHTGQRHQLRVHMNALGLPIRGDCLYPAIQTSKTSEIYEPSPSSPASRPTQKNRDEENRLQGLQLLAKELAFVDPISGQFTRFVSTQNLNAWDSMA